MPMICVNESRLVEDGCVVLDLISNEKLNKMYVSGEKIKILLADCF